MLQLVYISRATIPLSEAEVGAICVQSEDNNRRDEITGLMVFTGDQFLQVLEGPQHTVEEAFLRIIVDPRHCDLTLLSRRITPSRAFGLWDMRHCRTVEARRNAVAKVVPLIEHAPDHVRQAFDLFMAHLESEQRVV